MGNRDWRKPNWAGSVRLLLSDVSMLPCKLPALVSGWAGARAAAGIASALLQGIEGLGQGPESDPNHPPLRALN